MRMVMRIGARRARGRLALARAGLALAGAAAALGCASTDVSTTMQYGGALPRPQQILIFPFATSPEEVQLDWSPTAMAAWKMQGIARSQEQADVAHKVAQTLASKLAAKVQAMGLPAQLVSGDVPAPAGPTLSVTGMFVAIDEGNRAERFTIGLGAGRSDVKISTQVAELLPEGRRIVDQFDIDAKSGRKPGAAETMGMGAVAGHVAVSAAVTAAGAVASEAFGDSVEADTERAASKIATVLQAFFARQGWVAPK